MASRKLNYKRGLHSISRGQRCSQHDLTPCTPIHQWPDWLHSSILTPDTSPPQDATTVQATTAHTWTKARHFSLALKVSSYTAVSVIFSSLARHVFFCSKSFTDFWLLLASKRHTLPWQQAPQDLLQPTSPTVAVSESSHQGTSQTGLLWAPPKNPRWLYLRAFAPGFPWPGILFLL